MKNIVLITGASSGLGKHLSYSFLKEGWKVLGIARKKFELMQIKKDFGENFDFFLCDVTQQDQVHELAKLLNKRNLFPSLIILNAGIFDVEQNNILDVELHKKLFYTNYFGCIYFLKEWLEDFSKLGGSFVLVSSFLVKKFLPFANAYGASKTAITEYFESLKIRYGSTKANFITVYAGPMKGSAVKSKIPYIENYNVAAEYITRKIIKRSSSIYFPFFYRFLFFLLRFVPKSLIKCYYNFFFSKRNK